MTKPYRLHLLGIPRIKTASQTITHFRSRRVLGLLAYVALAEQAVPRVELLALLWPEKSESEGRKNLRWALNQAKKLLPHGWETTREAIALRPDAHLSIDTATLKVALESGEITQVLPSITIEPLMQGVFLDQSPAFETWLLQEREWWRSTVRSAIFQYVEGQLHENPPAVLPYARLLVTQDAWQEDGHRLVMRVLAATGNREGAARQFARCQRVLADELGVEVSAETATLHHLIQTGSSTPNKQRSPVLNLPVSTTRLVGREQILKSLHETLLLPECRLVTITGMGGMGKTRLAIALAHDEARSRNVWWVPLAGVQPNEGIAPVVDAVAAALGLSFYNTKSPQEQLVRRLQGQNGLLILDNLEHLLPGDAAILDLLREILAAGVQVVATSRERLHLPGEWLIELDGLPVKAAAVELFDRCARRLGVELDRTVEQPHVEAICEAVGGMPLAIELAATWLRSLSCAEIAAEVAQGIDFLATTSRGLPERHRSLEAVFRYSWQMLSAESQKSISRLAIFRGGFDRLAAKAVTGSTLPVLRELVDRSFLRRGATGRYQLHETVRQFALEQLSTAQRNEAADSHARWFAERLEIVQISAEIDNIRAAWRWSCNHDVALAMRYITPLADHFEQNNLTEEMIRLYEIAVADPFAQQTDLTTLACRWRKIGDGYYALGQFTRCRENLERALTVLEMPLPGNTVALGLALSKHLAVQMKHRAHMPAVDLHAQGRKLEAVRTLDRLGQVYFFESDGVATGYAVLKALNLAETLPISAERARLYASTTLALGIMGRNGMAHIYQRAALETLAQINDPVSRIWVLEVLSIYNAGLGNWEQVETWLTEAMTLCDHHNEDRRKDECRSILAICNFHQGRIQETHAIWQAMFHEAAQRNDTQMRYWSAYGIIDMALRRDKLEACGDILTQLPRIDAEADRNDATTEITNCAVRALLALEQNNLTEAHRQVQKGLIPANSESPTSFSMLEGYVNLLEASFGLISADPARFAHLHTATKQLVQSVRRFASVFPIGKPAAAFCEAWLLAQNGNRAEAEKLIAHGIISARQLRMPYDEARLLALRGLVKGSSAEFAQAQQLFTQIGAFREVHRCRHLLQHKYH